MEWREEGAFKRCCTAMFTGRKIKTCFSAKNEPFEGMKKTKTKKK